MKQKILMIGILLGAVIALPAIFWISDYLMEDTVENSREVANPVELSSSQEGGDRAGQEGENVQEQPVQASQDEVPFVDMVSYEVLFDNSKLHQIKLVVTEEEWDGLSGDMLDYASKDGSMRTGNYRKADLIYTDENGEVMLGEVGFRTKGNTSRTLPEDENGLHRFHFKLKFNETFAMTEGTSEFEARDNRTFGGLEELNFKANNGSDSSYIREIFSYDLLNAFGVITARASMAELTIIIDGVEQDYGIVTYTEPVDKDFLTKRFGKEYNDGNLYKCLWQNYGPATLMPLERVSAVGIKDWEKNYRPAYDLKTNKKEKNFDDLKDFIEQINALEGEEFKAYLDSHMEVDRFIKAQALDVLLGHIDGYRSMGNNYYLYFHENGKAEWIPYDYDNILGAGWDGAPNWSYEGIATADIYEWKNLNAVMYDPDTTHPLTDKLLQEEEYRSKYEEYLLTLINPDNNYFTYDRFLALYEQLYALYGDKVDNVMYEGDTWSLSNEEWYFHTKIRSVSEQLER